MDETKAREVLATQAPSDEFLQFTRALMGAKVLDADELLYYLEKPWKWAAAFAAWDNNGRPTDDTEQGWDAFLAAVEA